MVAQQNAGQMSPDLKLFFFLMDVNFKIYF